MEEFLTEVRPRDTRSMRQIEALLKQEGIRLDPHLDYTCAIMDEEGRVLGTGSCFGNTLRCLAVDAGRQGEGLISRVVSHLMEVQTARHNTHVFLYTKAKAARLFRDLGFFEIVHSEGKAADGFPETEPAVFMENKRDGFCRYLAELEKTRRPGSSCAIVMHANPFTRGHRYLVEQAAAAYQNVHLFILSEEYGPIPFAVRKKLVMAGTADLANVILHDSGPYIISGATFPSYFLGGEDAVVEAHAELDVRVFCRIAAALGVTQRYVGEEPFDHVTALYNEVMKVELPRFGLECREIPRLRTGGQAISASKVRQLIREGSMEQLPDYLTLSGLAYFRSAEAEPVIRALQADQAYRK